MGYIVGYITSERKPDAYLRQKYTGDGEIQQIFYTNGFIAFGTVVFFTDEKLENGTYLFSIVEESFRKAEYQVTRYMKCQMIAPLFPDDYYKELFPYGVKLPECPLHRMSKLIETLLRILFYPIDQNIRKYPIVDIYRIEVLMRIIYSTEEYPELLKDDSWEGIEYFLKGMRELILGGEFPDLVLDMLKTLENAVWDIDCPTMMTIAMHFKEFSIPFIPEWDVPVGIKSSLGFDYSENPIDRFKYFDVHNPKFHGVCSRGMLRVIHGSVAYRMALQQGCQIEEDLYKLPLEYEELVEYLPIIRGVANVDIDEENQSICIYRGFTLNTEQRINLLKNVMDQKSPVRCICNALESIPERVDLSRIGECYMLLEELDTWVETDKNTEIHFLPNTKEFDNLVETLVGTPLKESENCHYNIRDLPCVLRCLRPINNFVYVAIASTSSSKLALCEIISMDDIDKFSNWLNPDYVESEKERYEAYVARREARLKREEDRKVQLQSEEPSERDKRWMEDARIIGKYFEEHPKASRAQCVRNTGIAKSRIPKCIDLYQIMKDKEREEKENVGN